MRKIFRRKPRNDEQALARKIEHHKSDPGAIILGPARKVNGLTTQRSISLPVQEALQPMSSHPVSPPDPDLRSDNEFIPQSRESSLDFLTRPRRNTLPSIVLSPDDATSLASALTGLAPRPLSVRGRKRVGIQDEKAFAVTGGPESKRRSQSAGALRESIEERRLEQLKRGDHFTIRRKSPKRPRTSSHGENTLSNDTYRNISTRKARDDSHPPTALDVSTPADDPDHPFPAVSSIEDHAVQRTQEVVNLDERVDKIEEQMKVLDRTVSRLLRQAHRTTVLLARSSSRRPHSRGRHSSPSWYSQASFTPEDELSFMSQKPDDLGIHRRADVLGEEAPLESIEQPIPLHAELEPVCTFLSSPTPTLPDYPDSPGSHTDSSIESPTIRALRASQSSIQAASTMPLISAADHCSALLSLLEREELARRKLEKQISSLQQEVRELKAQSCGQAYPTPSPDPHVGTVSRFSAFDNGEDDEDADQGVGGNGNGEGKDADDEFHQTPTEEVRRICWPSTGGLQLEPSDTHVASAGGGGDDEVERKGSLGHLTQPTSHGSGMF
ncbi:MAG: hypothetical protein M1819_002635 [Sarea resinae]|nr:MAG: hypothetical protein M1819_002635 [Sarea resinae]